MANEQKPTFLDIHGIKTLLKLKCEKSYFFLLWSQLSLYPLFHLNTAPIWNWITPLNTGLVKTRMVSSIEYVHLLFAVLIKTPIYNFLTHSAVQQMHDSFNLTKGVSLHFTGENVRKCSINFWNSSFRLLLAVHHYSACSCSCPGMSHRMLSVRMVAYIIKLIRKNKENTSSQSTLFIKVLGRGPIWSAWVTTTFFLASIPEREISCFKSDRKHTR